MVKKCFPGHTTNAGDGYNNNRNVLAKASLKKHEIGSAGMNLKWTLKRRHPIGPRWKVRRSD